jgi:hypothetical protein
MKTEDLIGLLARDAGPAPKALAARRLGMAVALGLLLALPAAAWLKSPTPLVTALFAESGMWLKLIYAAVLAGVAVAWVSRLGKPGMPAERWPLALVLAVAAVGLLGLANVATAPEGARAATVLGYSWRECPRNVLLLALPTLAGTLWALRGLAPTRPRLAGLAAGITAGGVGAFAYALFCIEIAPAFIAVWYTLGVAAAGALGAVLGPRVLRW